MVVEGDASTAGVDDEHIENLRADNHRRDIRRLQRDVVQDARGELAACAEVVPNYRAELPALVEAAVARYSLHRLDKHRRGKGRHDEDKEDAESWRDPPRLLVD